ncbi:hypothetical protein NMY22_g7153 [Coprinellus aureogranulatus]|nr:hypothetical protein NMY22_g7153 [Coprinellus aureogranulatus]
MSHGGVLPAEADQGNLASPALTERSLNINDLPNEIFAMVFDLLRTSRAEVRGEVDVFQAWSPHACFGWCMPFFPLAVCTRWRDAGEAFPALWSWVRVKVSLRQLCNNPSVLWIHNQPEIDFRTQRSRSVPLKLSFSSRPQIPFNSVEPRSTPFRIGNIIHRITAIFLDMSCMRLLSSFSSYSLKNLTRIHIGDSQTFQYEGTATTNQVHVHHFIGARFWKSDLGVKEVVWSAGSHRILESSLEWEYLTVLRIPKVDISEWDVLTLLKDCIRLRVLDTTIVQHTDIPGRTNMSEAVIGPLPSSITNAALQDWSLRQICQTRVGRGNDRRCLPGVATPNMKKIRVEHSGLADLDHLYFLTNSQTVGYESVLRTRPLSWRFCNAHQCKFWCCLVAPRVIASMIPFRLGHPV